MARAFSKEPTSHPHHHTVRICQVILSNLFLIQQLPLHRERSTRHMRTAVHHEFQPNIHMHLHMHLQSPTCNWISLKMGHLCLEKQKWSVGLDKSYNRQSYIQFITLKKAEIVLTNTADASSGGRPPLMCPSLNDCFPLLRTPSLRPPQKVIHSWFRLQRASFHTD